MKTKVDRGAIRDLFKAMNELPECMIETLEAIRQVLPQIEAGGAEAEEAMKQAAQNLYEKRKEEYQQYSQGGEMMALVEVRRFRDYLTELEYYTDKEAVIEAAIIEAHDIDRKAKRLRQLQKQIQWIYRSLDARSKALLQIHTALVFTDSHINETDFSILLYDLGPVDVEVLEKEKQFAPLLEAYHAAKDIERMLS